MAADRVIAATSLLTVSGGGAARTLAAAVSNDSGGGGGGDAALGSGAFGEVGAFRYHGAAVAVKELKAGADEVSIGALVNLNTLSRSVPVPYLLPARAGGLSHRLCYFTVVMKRVPWCLCRGSW